MVRIVMAMVIVIGRRVTAMRISSSIGLLVVMLFSGGDLVFVEYCDGEA